VVVVVVCVCLFVFVCVFVHTTQNLRVNKIIGVAAQFSLFILKLLLIILLGFFKEKQRKVLNILLGDISVWRIQIDRDGQKMS